MSSNQPADGAIARKTSAADRKLLDQLSALAAMIGVAQARATHLVVEKKGDPLTMAALLSDLAREGRACGRAMQVVQARLASAEPASPSPGTAPASQRPLEETRAARGGAPPIRPDEVRDCDWDEVLRRLLE